MFSSPLLSLFKMVFNMTYCVLYYSSISWAKGKTLIDLMPLECALLLMGTLFHFLFHSACQLVVGYIFYSVPF